MCEGVLFEEGGRRRRLLFSHTGAQLPVVTRSGGPLLMPWGRKRREGGELPLGGWAVLETIHAGRWDAWQPRPVRLAVTAFMERDIQGQDHWFPLSQGQWLQGLLARAGAERRVYVVTITPHMPDTPYARWPRILNDG